MAGKRILILGAGGRLGAALAREYAKDNTVEAFGRKEADLSVPDAVARLVTRSAPEVVINCAAMTNVDECETERQLAETVNSDAPRAIAEACSSLGARMIHISTDYVFSGTATKPYAEDDDTEPASWYGESKLRGECGVIAAGAGHAIVRVSWVFGPDRDSFVDKALQLALKGEPVRAVADKYSSPTYVMDVAAGLRPLLGSGPAGGVYHLCNAGVCTWRDWAQQAIDAAVAAGIPIRTRTVEPLKLCDIAAMKAARPVYSAMLCEKLERLLGKPIRRWQDAVTEYVGLLVQLGRLPQGLA